MDIVKAILRVGFASAFHPWLELRDFLRAAQGNPAIEIQGLPLEIDQPDKKVHVVLQIRAFTLEQEGPSLVNEGVAYVIELLEKLHKASPLPAVSQIRYDTFFIEPYRLPFHELIAVMKKQFLRPSLLVNTATDIGLIFDQHDGEVIKHIQVGPMQATQLHSMFLRWPREQLPDQFLFMALGYERKREIDFAVRDVHDFMESAIKWQKEQAEAVLTLVRQGEG